LSAAVAQLKNKVFVMFNISPIVTANTALSKGKKPLSGSVTAMPTVFAGDVLHFSGSKKTQSKTSLKSSQRPMWQRYLRSVWLPVSIVLGGGVGFVLSILFSAGTLALPVIAAGAVGVPLVLLLAMVLMRSKKPIVPDSLDPAKKTQASCPSNYVEEDTATGKRTINDAVKTALLADPSEILYHGYLQPSAYYSKGYGGRVVGYANQTDFQYLWNDDSRLNFFTAMDVTARETMAKVLERDFGKANDGQPIVCVFQHENRIILGVTVYDPQHHVEHVGGRIRYRAGQSQFLIVSPNNELSPLQHLFLDSVGKGMPSEGLVAGFQSSKKLDYNGFKQVLMDYCARPASGNGLRGILLNTLNNEYYEIKDGKRIQLEPKKVITANNPVTDSSSVETSNFSSALPNDANQGSVSGANNEGDILSAAQQKAFLEDTPELYARTYAREGAWFYSNMGFTNVAFGPDGSMFGTHRSRTHKQNEKVDLMSNFSAEAQNLRKNNLPKERAALKDHHERTQITIFCSKSAAKNFCIGIEGYQPFKNNTHRILSETFLMASPTNKPTAIQQIILNWLNNGNPEKQISALVNGFREALHHSKALEYEAFKEKWLTETTHPKDNQPVRRIRLLDFTQKRFEDL